MPGTGSSPCFTGKSCVHIKKHRILPDYDGLLEMKWRDDNEGVRLLRKDLYFGKTQAQYETIIGFERPGTGTNRYRAIGTILPNHAWAGR
jgi:hypothetical protein